MKFVEKISYFSLFRQSKELPGEWDGMDFKQCLKEYKSLQSGNKTLAELAFKKTLSLAQTVEECLEASNTTWSTSLKEEAQEKAIALAQTIEQCLDVHRQVKYATREDLKKALQTKILNKTQTSEECIETYKKIYDNPLRKDLLEKAERLAQNFGQYLDIYMEARWYSEFADTEKAALKKMAELAENYRQYLETYEDSIGTSDTEIGKKMLDKILDTAKTFEQCHEICIGCHTFLEFDSMWPPLSISIKSHIFSLNSRIARRNVMEAMLDKMAELAQTFGQHLKLYDWMPDNKFRQIVLEKTARLAESLEQRIDVYKRTPADSNLEGTLRAKIVSLAQTFEECSKAYDLAPADSDLEKELLKKMAGLAQTSEQRFETIVAHRLEVAESKRKKGCT